MNPRSTTGVLFLLIFCSSTPLYASQLWGVTIANGTSIALHPIDSSTGMVSGSIFLGMGLNFANVDDLASDPARQPSIVWAIRTSIGGNELIAVDPFQQQLLSLVHLNAPAPIESLAIDPTDGAFYGATTAALYRIAPDTGTTTLAGPTAMPVHKALGFDLAGNLYGIANNRDLIAVNKATGATSLVATLNLERMEDIAARPEDGVMFGLGYADYSLFQINLTSGQLTNVGPSLSRPGGLAFTVPEPAAMLLCSLALSCLIARRRSQFSRRPSAAAKR